MTVGLPVGCAHVTTGCGPLGVKTRTQVTDVTTSVNAVTAGEESRRAHWRLRALLESDGVLDG